MAKVRLNNANAIRLFIADIMNELRDKKITCNEAKTQGYLAGVLLRAIETTEIEERIRQLEMKGSGVNETFSELREARERYERRAANDDD